MKYLFNSKGKHIANLVNGQLHSPTGTNIGHYLEKEKTLLEIIEKKSRKKIIKNKKEKIGYISKELVKRIEKALASIPKKHELSEFQNNLIDLENKKGMIKKTVLELLRINNFIKSLGKKTVFKIKKNEKKQQLYIKMFFGRLYSIEKRFNKTAKNFNEIQKIISKLPDIKDNEFIIVLANLSFYLQCKSYFVFQG